MKLKRIEIRNLWGKDVHWDFKEDVNVLIGINGSGKTTILQLIKEALSHKNDEDIDFEKFYPIDEMILELDGNLIIQINSEERRINDIGKWENIKISMVNTFDVPQRNFDPKLSGLDNEIGELKKEFITYQRNYLSKQVEELLKNGDEKDPTKKIKKLEDIVFNKELFLKIINDLFKETGKVFNEEHFNFNLKENKNPIEPEKLSSGEKQIFIILLRTFLQEKKPCILLLDEPEISLHISWQRKLLSCLRDLNPNCQLILATHSASVFYLNWEDRVFRMEEITKKSGLSLKSHILETTRNFNKNVFEWLKKRFEVIEHQNRKNKGRILYLFNIELNKIAAISGKAANQVLDFLDEKKIDPDVVTLTTLISKVTSFAQGKQVFQKFKTYNNVYPNEITLNMLLKKAENANKGINTIREVKEKYGLYPDIISFSTLLGKAKNIKEVESVEDARKYYKVATNERYLKKLKYKR